MKKLFLVPAGVVALAVLGACGSSSDSAADTSSASSAPSASSTPSAPSSAAATEMSSAAAGSASAGGSTGAPGSAGGAVQVGKTISDPVFGNDFLVEKVVPSASLPADFVSKWAGLQGDDNQFLLVKVKATAGTKYYGTAGAGDLFIKNTQDSFNFAESDDLTGLSDVLASEGYSPMLKDAETGKSSEGWIFYNLNHKESKLTLVLHRNAYGTSDGKNIPEKDFELPLT